MCAEMRKFDQTTLGQPVMIEPDEASAIPVDAALCAIIGRWSGSGDAALVSSDRLDPTLAPDAITGRVVARHLDGTRQADVELILSQAGGRARAVVRVTLG